MTIKKDVLVAKSLALDFDLLVKLLMWIRKAIEPKMKPWGAPARNVFHNEVYSFKINLLIFSKKVIKFF